MKKPVLVIMAAGMGSRFGGLKQIEPMDDAGHIIMVFSIYDAKRAGFEKVIFIIKKENEEAFRTSIGDRISQYIEVEYVYQELTKLPPGFTIPEGREKPFGTGHAILCCMDSVDSPFVVINADDYYGVHGFSAIYDYLSTTADDEWYRFAMVGYLVKNTLTENGYVSRGICEMDEEGYLTGITERTRIEHYEDGVAYSEDDGATWTTIDPEGIASMNMFGFSQSMMKELAARFPQFLETSLKENPLKGEFFLPSVVSDLISEKKATVKVLKSTDRWYGITYKEDKQGVVDAIQKMKDEGIYPQELWG